MITFSAAMSVAGAVLSLLFEYVPGFKDLYGKVDKDKKRLIMVLIVAVVFLAGLGLSYTPFAPMLHIAPPEDVNQWAFTVINAIVMFLVNQGTYHVVIKKDDNDDEDLIISG